MQTHFTFLHFVRNIIPACLFSIISFTGLAQPNIVKNIDPVDAQGGALKFTGNVVNIGTNIYFAADNNVNGIELWKSDGTPGGTSIVYDIPGDGSIYNIVNVNGILYYFAVDATHGRELWKSDGTTAGTMLVKDIIPGTIGGCTYSSSIVNIGNTIYFKATDGTNGVELWKSDGTDAGTVMVKNINPSGDGMGSELMAIGSVLYFTATDGSTIGTELYSSNGTVGNATLLKDVNPTANMNGVSGGFTALNGKLIFVGSDGTNGKELWISDNTPAGTQMIKNIDGSAGDAVSFLDFAVMGNYIYFKGQDATYGAELWRSDGTSAGTTLVKDIWTGAGFHGVPNGFRNVNGTLYFTAKNTGTGYELWKSDGTDAGTVQVKDINTGIGDSGPSAYTYLNGKIYFSATDASNGTELWETDGTANGTVLVKDIYPGVSAAAPRGFTVMGNTLYFGCNDGINGLELWSYTPGVPLLVPTSVTDLSGKVTTNYSVALSWTDSNIETSYDIEKSVGNNTSYAKLTSLDADINTYSATGLTAGTVYYFRIRESNLAGYSAYSNEISITIPVIPAPVISVTLSSATSVVLDWASIPNINSYITERSLTSGTGFGTPVTAGYYATQQAIPSLTPGTTYYFHVYTRQLVDGNFVYSVNSNEVSITIPVSPPPVAPSGFTATLVGSTASLSWTDASGETSYSIERSVNGTNNFVSLATPAANVVTYSDAGLLPDHVYYYRLRYVSGGINSFYSHYSNYPYVVTVPAVPSNVGASVTAPGEVTITWSDVMNESSYYIQSSLNLAGPYTAISSSITANSTSYVLSGLVPGTMYYFRLVAVGGAGSSYSSVLNITLPPAVPTGLTATNTADLQVTLNWADVSGETQYLIEQSIGNATSFSQINTTSANVTQLVVNGLTAGTTYYYRVSASNTGGNSGVSANASLTVATPKPSVPAGLTATNSADFQITLNWTDVSGETQYKIEQSIGNATSFAQINTTSTNVTQLVISGLAAGTTYYYRVIATNAGGDSNPSANASCAVATPKPAVPAGLTATNSANLQVTLNWTDVSGETQYKIEQSIGNTSSFTQINTPAANVTQLIINGLTAGTTYYFRVIATNAGGDSNPSAYVNVTVATPVVVPLSPSGLTAVNSGDLQVTLNWTDVSGETLYKIEQSIGNSSSFAQINATGANVTQLVITGLIAGTTYYYRVIATNAGGDSNPSANASVLVSTPVIAPIAPAGLVATNSGNLQVTLNWTDVNDETQYKIEQSIGNTTSFVQINTTNANITQLVIDGLTAGTTYSYRVKATNTAGDSPFSSTSTVTLPTVTSITTKTSLSSISVYPNPSIGWFMIKSAQKAQLIVFDPSGAKVLDTDIQSGIEKIDLESRVKGVYLLQITCDGDSKNYKLIVK